MLDVLAVKTVKHVLRSDSQQIGRRVLKMELPGSRPIRRPKRRFMAAVKEEMK